MLQSAGLPKITFMPSRHFTRGLFLTIFLVACGLRLAVAFYNRESNDPHIAVIRLIVRSGTLPTRDDCSQCYHPKLFHYASAAALRVAGMLEAPKDEQIRFVQLINALAGTATVVVAWSFLSGLDSGSPAWKAAAFGLFALNPKLIGINGQVTNDTFVILFSSLTLYLAARFLRGQSLAATIVCAVLSISAKSNGIVTALAVLLALVVKWSVDARRRESLLYAAVFTVGVCGISVLNPLNQYAENMRQYASPVVSNADRPPAAELWIKSYTPYAGVLSISDAMLTFRFSSLLETPRNRRADLDYPAHRNSFWAQIYAQSQSVHFDAWPMSWRPSRVPVNNITRAIFWLALVPSALLAGGILTGAVRLVRDLLRRNGERTASLHYGLFLFAALGFTAAAALYSMEMRRYTAMKAIYLYPALLAFVPLFLQATDALREGLLSRSRAVAAALFAAIVALLALYVVDVWLLIVRLRSLV